MALAGDLITVADSATRLSSTVVDCTEITVRALASNAANVFFGGSDVSATDNWWIFLQPGESYTWGASGGGTRYDLREIYYISANTTDKFTLMYNKA